MPMHSPQIHQDVEVQASVSQEAQGIVSFWFSGPTPEKRWFAKDDAFDAQIKKNFSDLVEQARKGLLENWAETPKGALALVILLDQFPRNMFRGEAEAFASDSHALRIAARAVAQGHAAKLSFQQRTFLYLPFEHSESLPHQIASVALFESEMNGAQEGQQKIVAARQLEYARRHLHCILLFGRFPGRNKALSRAFTAAELAFVEANPEGF